MRVWRALVLLTIALAASAAAPPPAEWQVASPNGALVVTIVQAEDGGLRYSVALNGKPVVESSRLGLALAWVDQSKPDVVQHADLATTVSVEGADGGRIDDAYIMVTGKRRANHYSAEHLILHTRDVETERLLDIEFQLSAMCWPTGA
jgi:hypothetical protein